MIILRQREYGKKKEGESIFLTQPGDLHMPDILWKNSTRLQDGPERKEAYMKIVDDKNKMFENKRLQKAREKKYKGGAYVDDKNIYIEFFHGREKNASNPRKIANVFISDKSPAEAYRDFLRSADQRLKLKDFIEDGEGNSVTTKEIKDAIRKGIRERNIRKAAPWVIGGTVATAGTIAGIHAYKKHKKDKEK